MSSTESIHQRMAAIMREVAYIQKEDKKVNDQYRFVSHDAVMRELRGPMLTHGVVVAFDVSGHTEEVLPPAKDAKSVYTITTADVTARFFNIDNPGDFIQVRGFGQGIDHQDKGPGKAVSYACKYILLKAFMLETGDDPDRDLTGRPIPAEPLASEAQCADINILFDSLAMSPENRTRGLRKYGVERVADLTQSAADKIIAGLTKTIEAAKAKTETD